MVFQNFKQTHSEWVELQRLLDSDKPVIIDGQSLTITGVVAVALYVSIHQSINAFGASN